MDGLGSNPGAGWCGSLPSTARCTRVMISKLCHLPTICSQVESSMEPNPNHTLREGRREWRAGGADRGAAVDGGGG